MLQSLTLKFTEVPTELHLGGAGITIFVGPNNSGKSLVLREIEGVFLGWPQPANKILKDYAINWMTEAEVDTEVEALRKSNPQGTPPDHAYLGRYLPGGQLDTHNIHLPELKQYMVGKNNKQWLAQNFYRLRTLRLDGRTRFSLTDDKALGDLLAKPTNAIAHLFTDEGARKDVRDLIHDAFGRYLVIDPTNSGNGRIRLSEKPPMADEQSLNVAARAFHQAAQYIKEASDGVQAYVGIVMAVLSGEYKTIMIDEPEAFLHPPLARKLGRQLATLMDKRKGSLFASTHSADFLIGCVQGSKSVNVVRLGYGGGKSKGRIVDAASLETILKHPLMRSANVVSGLFHDGVVVTESDNDRAFYAEIYYRIQDQMKDAPSILFLNAQNKQTAKTIVAPLRQFGIPAVAIVDIDVVKDGGKTWTEWLQAIEVPDALQAGYSLQRDSINKLLDGSGRNMKTEGGIDLLSANDKQAAEALFTTLDQYGLFVVRKGELESWLPALGAVGKKTDWTISALSLMGTDPKAPNYVTPTNGDVWDFMRTIITWIKAKGG